VVLVAEVSVYFVELISPAHRMYGSRVAPALQNFRDGLVIESTVTEVLGAYMACFAYLTPSALDYCILPLYPEDYDPASAPFDGYSLIQVWDVELANG